MPRLTHGIHIRVSESERSVIWCGGSTLWDMKSASENSVPLSEADTIIRNGGAYRTLDMVKKVRSKKRKMKYPKPGRPKLTKTVLDPVCGRCRTGYEASKRKKRVLNSREKRERVAEREKNRRQAVPKIETEDVGVKLSENDQNRQKSIKIEPNRIAEVASVPAPKSVSIPDPIGDPVAVDYREL